MAKKNLNVKENLKELGEKNKGFGLNSKHL